MSLLAGFAILCDLAGPGWFYQDDWDFLLSRGLHHPLYGLWVPHYEHWSTLPILEYRLSVTLFGIRSQWPTLLVLLLAHVGVTHLLWRVALRARVDPSIATVLAAIFLLLGAGSDDIVWDFQIGFVAAVALGLLALQVDRLSTDRRTRLGLVWALLVCGLMCSSIGVTMTVAATVDCWARRGRGRALATASLPITVYVVWYVAVGHQGFTHDHLTLTLLLGMPPYMWSALSDALGSTFGLDGSGPLLVLTLLAWTLHRARAARRTRASTAFGLAAGAVFLVASIAFGRDSNGITGAGTSRYVYLVIALLLPLIGVALTDLIRAAGGAPVVRRAIVVVLVGVLVGGVGTLRTAAAAHVTTSRQFERRILAAVVVLRDGDPILQADPDPAPQEVNLTSAGLLLAARSGQLPSPHPTEAELLTAKADINASVTRTAVLRAPLPDGTSGCITSADVTVHIPLGGGHLTVNSPSSLALGVRLQAPDGTTSEVHNLQLASGPSVLNLGASRTLATVTPSAPGITFCP